MDFRRITFKLLLTGFLPLAVVADETRDGGPLPPNTWECAVEPGPGVNYDRAIFRLWADPTVERVRAVLLLAPGWQGDGRNMVEEAAWQELARRHRLAVVAVFLRSAAGGNSYHRAEGGSGEALVEALRRLAAASGRPEVGDAPLLVWGYSAGGQFGYGLGCVMPERVIAFAAIKGGYYQTRSDPRVREVPAILVSGEKDQDWRRENIRRLFEENRRAGAVWCWAEEPRAGHEPGRANEVILPFLEAALVLRLPAEGGGRLRSVDPSAGWTGRIDAPAIAPPGEPPGASPEATVWLPDAATAEAWLRFVTARPPEPPSDGTTAL